MNSLPEFSIYNTTFDLMSGSNNTKQFNVSWAVNGVGIGSNNLNVSVTMLDEANSDNNFELTPFDVVLLGQPVFEINTSVDDVKPGSSLFVFGSVTSPDGMPLINTTMSLYLADSAGAPVSPLVPVVTDSTGAYSGTITIPTEASGDVFVTLKIDNGDQPRYGNKEISVQSDGGSDIPWWMILAIIAAVAVVIIIFVAYLYKHSLGKMVECGECGALIPEDSKRCPKCGVVFETGTAKCSECGAWIPSNASECPECHAKFLTEPGQEEQGDAYMKAMQEQYDEYVNTYREQAKAALGAKYSEDKFQEWLKTEPGFLTFDAWLVKREEDKKSGAFACPTCGILNPRGSTVCHKCGMVFANAPVAEVKEQPRTFRRIVKRSDKSPPKEEPKVEEKK
jgi:ribosomal protein L40E